MFCAIFGTFLVFLLTDYLRYKPVMIFNGLVGMLAYICLMSPPTIIGLKVCGIGTISRLIVIFLFLWIAVLLAYCFLPENLSLRNLLSRTLLFWFEVKTPFSSAFFQNNGVDQPYPWSPLFYRPHFLRAHQQPLYQSTSISYSIPIVSFLVFFFSLFSYLFFSFLILPLTFIIITAPAACVSTLLITSPKLYENNWNDSVIFKSFQNTSYDIFFWSGNHNEPSSTEISDFFR